MSRLEQFNLWGAIVWLAADFHRDWVLVAAAGYCLLTAALGLLEWLMKKAKSDGA